MSEVVARLAIDTDQSGGLVLGCKLPLPGSPWQVRGVWSAPTRSGKWHQGDADQTFPEIAQLTVGFPIVVSIERPQAIYKPVRVKGRMQSKIMKDATIKLAMMAGRYVERCESMGWSVELVSVDDWQRAMLAGAPGRTTKDKSLFVAAHRWPGIDLQPGRRRVDQHGVADAACILAYAIEQDRRR